jgi:hypothetical protein
MTKEEWSWMLDQKVATPDHVAILLLTRLKGYSQTHPWQEDLAIVANLVAALREISRPN